MQPGVVEITDLNVTEHIDETGDRGERSEYQCPPRRVHLAKEDKYWVAGIVDLYQSVLPI